MTYEELKQKYSTKMKDRQSEINVARSLVDLKKAHLESWTQQREEYRLNPGEVNVEKQKGWMACSAKILQMKKELSEAENNLARVMLNGKDIII